MATNPELEPNTWINEDPARMLQAETWIFDAAICNYDFWLNVSERVCAHPEHDKDIDDFDSVHRNILFTGIRKLSRINQSNSRQSTIAPNKPDPSVLEVFLMHEASQGNICTEGEVPGAIAFYRTRCATAQDSPDLINMAMHLVPAWLSRKRAKFLGVAARNMSLDQLMDASERHSDVVSSISTSSEDIVLYGKHARYSEESGGITLTTLPNLSKSLGGLNKGDSYMFQAQTGGGKCFAKGTELIMFNGTTKCVEDVVVGDLLIGPDSSPRKVISLACGREQMYRITPVKGDYYDVNESHILSLKIGNGTTGSGVKSHGSFNSHVSGDIVNITVLDYLKSKKSFKHVSKGWRVGVTWDALYAEELPIPAYIIGLWLGDGNSRTSALTTIDKEIEKEWIDYGKSRDLQCRRAQINKGKTKAETLYLKTERGAVNPMLEDLKRLNLIKNKHIPKCYLVASEAVRLELLAGLMDSDGTNHRSGFDYVSKSERLAQDVAFLARSLGFAAYVSACRKKSQNDTEGTYFRISITGDKCLDVPLRLKRKVPNRRLIKKDHLLHGIKSVMPLGVGDYYGFELEGPDRLFLLKDFTVVHNTVMAVQLLVDLVGSNNCGIFISTEQPWKELEPRIIANTCQIDIAHDALKNRFDYNALKSQKFHLSKVDEWEAAAANKFAFFHWNSDNTQSVKTDLEATLRKGKALLGKDPDFVILDWIGGAIGSEANSENLRFTYQATADAFAASAQKHKFIGIAFAQSKGDKVFYSLSSEHLAECKTMHRKYTALVGITAITVKDEKEMDGSKAKYENKQYFDVSKSRKGEPARIAVDRLFQFQKFQERGKFGGGATTTHHP